MTYVIEVPGRFADGVAFLDVETRKVPAGRMFGCGYVMQTGEVLKNRWQAFLVGVGRDGKIVIVDEPDEPTLLYGAAKAVGKRDIFYSATREFDEMVLKGRFTNARRAHEPFQFYPAMPGSKLRNWVNMRKQPSAPVGVRGFDVPSRDVPATWARGDRRVVLVHLLRDVAELILRYGDADEECRSWCEHLLANYAAAVGVLAVAK